MYGSTILHRKLPGYCWVHTIYQPQSTQTETIMIELKQTRLHRGEKPEERGNCYPTVIACILEMPVEEVIQFQELYDTVWYEPLNDWLAERGWEFEYLPSHPADDEPYFVTGISPRDPNVRHICIYRSGSMIWDPHPDGRGIITQDNFERLIRLV